MSSQPEYKVIGRRPIRHDGVDKVTGAAKYGADTRIPGMLYGAIKRSPHAHALILSIDTSKAEVLPGVTAVMTSDDLPQVSHEIVEMGEDSVEQDYLSSNVMARGKVLFHGHPVAAVSATDASIAEDALDLIEVKYQILPPVLDVESAMEKDAPILWEDLRTDEFGELGKEPTNVAKHLVHERGDLEKGFAEADVIVDRTFKTAMVHQGYIEPHASTCIWRKDGRIEVWTSTQGAFQIRDQMAGLLEVDVSRVKVTPTEIGGGFGGKFTVYTDLPAAVLSRKSGNRPVKITMSRTEVFQATGPTSGSVVKVKMGASKDGKLTASHATLIYEAGAVPGSPVGAGAGVILAPYKHENVRIDAYDVVVNRPKTGAYRAPGGTNAAFASETVIDELAEKLNMDPLEFRLKNAATEGDRRPDGPIYLKIGFKETVETAIDHPHMATSLEGQHRGRGVASGFWFNGGGRSSVSANVNADGTVNLVEGSTDIGGSRASIAMQLAESLGITAEMVNPQVVDTDSVGYTDGTGGSRVTFATGYAAYELGQRLGEIMCEKLSDVWETEGSSVKLESGVFSYNGKSADFVEAAGMLAKSSEPVVASVSVNPSQPGPAFATHIVDVEVDVETGKVDVLGYTAIQDVGKAIHPSYAEGQIQGGVVQGIGWALNEEYVYNDDGQLVNASLLDYRMPTSLDLPMIDTVMLEVPNPGHPYGVRGVGEVPIVPPAAAVANAIYDAIGIRMTELPMSPAKILEQIWAQNGK
jgi:xanthine dehydrogenase molybdenum-binding subunit